MITDMTANKGLERGKSGKEPFSSTQTLCGRVPPLADVFGRSLVLPEKTRCTIASSWPWIARRWPEKLKAALGKVLFANMFSMFLAPEILKRSGLFPEVPPTVGSRNVRGTEKVYFDLCERAYDAVSRGLKPRKCTRDCGPTRTSTLSLPPQSTGKKKHQLCERCPNPTADFVSFSKRLATRHGPCCPPANRCPVNESCFSGARRLKLCLSQHNRIFWQRSGMTIGFSNGKPYANWAPSRGAHAPSAARSHMG